MTSRVLEAIERTLRDRPAKVRVQTHEGFQEFCRRADAGQFKIGAMNVGKPGGEFKYELELSWPTEQTTFL